MNSDLETSVDTSTGKILTWWDKLKNWWSSWTPSNKTFSYDVSGNASDVDAADADQLTIGNNWTGSDSFAGGYTTLHEKGYELYDLPSGTRIYNHDSSEDLVKQTALEVANKVASNIAKNSYGGGSSQQIKIEVPVILDGKEFARVTTPYISSNLAFSSSRKGW